jgi:hypothetical protein
VFDTSIRVRWNPPLSDGGSAVTGYALTGTGIGSPISINAAAREYLVTGLTASQTYTYALAAVNGIGTGASATYRTVTTGNRPSVPQNLAASVTGDDAITVTWDPAASDGGAPIGWYYVEARSSNPSDPRIRKSAETWYTSRTFGGLNTSSSYTIRMNAINDPGYSPTATSSEVTFGDPNIQYSDGTHTVVTGYTGTASGTIYIPSGVLEIANSAFYGQGSMTGISLPSSLTTIQSQAFRDCTGLTTVTIPNSVTNIYDEVFRGCTSLASVSISTGISILRYNTFRSCTGLLSVTIPGNVATVGVSCFFGCSGLTTLVLQNGVSLLDDESFMNTTSLTSVTLSSPQPTIRASAFSGSAYTPPP